MSFWQKIGKFFKDFFKNVAADPVTTVSGLAKIAAGGAMIYAAPANVSGDVAAAGLITSGLVSLGTDHTTGQVNPTVAKAAADEQKLAAAAMTVDPLVKQVKDAIDAAGEQANTAARIQAAAVAVQKITEATQGSTQGSTPTT